MAIDYWDLDFITRQNVPSFLGHQSPSDPESNDPIRKRGTYTHTLYLAIAAFENLQNGAESHENKNSRNKYTCNLSAKIFKFALMEWVALLCCWVALDVNQGNVEFEKEQWRTHDRKCCELSSTVPGSGDRKGSEAHPQKIFVQKISRQLKNCIDMTRPRRKERLLTNRHWWYHRQKIL